MRIRWHDVENLRPAEWHTPSPLVATWSEGVLKSTVHAQLRPTGFYPSIADSMEIHPRYLDFIPAVSQEADALLPQTTGDDLDRPELTDADQLHGQRCCRVSWTPGGEAKGFRLDPGTISALGVAMYVDISGLSQGVYALVELSDFFGNLQAQLWWDAQDSTFVLKRPDGRAVRVSATAAMHWQWIVIELNQENHGMHLQVNAKDGLLEHVWNDRERWGSVDVGILHSLSVAGQLRVAHLQLLASPWLDLAPDQFFNDLDHSWPYGIKDSWRSHDLLSK